MTDPDATRELQPGLRLANRYTLKRQLGSARHTATWLADDRMTGAAVALKIAVDPAFSALLRREWQTGIRLMHAHIVRAFEFHEDAAGSFYSLQFIDGPDISVLTGNPLAHVLPPIALIADALRYAHGKGVVHRDVKASNVLLDHNGAPYLIDFGIAAVGGGNVGGGSPIAASPQSLGGEPPQPGDDVFALGGLIYELVSGRSPYNPATLAEDIRSTDPKPLTAASGEAVPPSISSLVARMLAKDATVRPDAETVAAELASAGFAGAAAPRDYVRTVAVPPVDDAVDAVIAPTGRRAGDAAAITADDHDRGSGAGLSTRTLGIAFVVLLAALLAVIFLLPKTVTIDAPAPVTGSTETETATPAADKRKSSVEFTENIEDLRGRDERVRARAATEKVLGELLSKMETLERRAVQRWAGLRFKQAQAVYSEGDEAYLARDYATATAKYKETIELIDPLLDEVDAVSATTLEEATSALEAGDTIEALRLFELAVAISPGHAGAQAGYARAKNLDTVLSLTDRGLVQEQELELDAALESFERAVDIDPQWAPAQAGLARVRETMQQMEFDQRMTEGLTALAERDFVAARAAFRMARQIKPESPEPADGLLQVDQGIRLARIEALERDAASEESAERWTAAVETYEEILELDANLAFAQQGLARARKMAELHAELDAYIADPDSLSAPSKMRKATQLVVDITRMPDIGPRLSDQRDELSRLLKRAATPLKVKIVSDNVTNVSIYKVGKLGTFTTQELSLRPGTYVAVGSRPGYRDVRLEFRVAPEIEIEPVVVRCEEPI